MTYLAIKSLHIVAAILWIGSLCLVTFVTSTSKMSADQMRVATRVTEASIGLTWLAGITLVIMGSWYGSAWWQIKVVLVILISAIHSIVHRRWKNAASEGASTNGAVPYFILLLTLVIVFLVVFKRPF